MIIWIDAKAACRTIEQKQRIAGCEDKSTTSSKHDYLHSEELSSYLSAFVHDRN